MVFEHRTCEQARKKAKAEGCRPLKHRPRCYKRPDRCDDEAKRPEAPARSPAEEKKSALY